MQFADERPDGAASGSETVTDPTDAARETMQRLVREHPMPPDDAPEANATADVAETGQPDSSTTDSGGASIYGGRSVVGLDVGTRTLKIVHLQTSGTGIRLVNAAVRYLPPPSDPERLDAVSETVEAFIASAKPRIKAACCALAGEGVATICCTMPKMGEKDLANALRWKVAEDNAVDAERSTVGFYALDKKRTTGNSALVVAAAPSHIGRLDALFSNDTPRLSLVISEPLAVDNVVAAAYHTEERGPVAVLDIGTTAAKLTITGRNGLEFTREIPVGGDTVTAALAGTVTLDSGPVEISRQAAEQLKRKYTVGDTGLVEAAGVVLPANRLLGAIRPVLERLASEIVRSSQFYAQSHGLAKIESLFICGGGATLGGLADYFTKETRIPATVLDPWRTLGFEMPPDLDADPALFAVATGAAIHDSSRINLLPAHIRARRVISAVRTISLVVTAVAFLALAGLSWTARQQAVELRKVEELKRESSAPMERMAKTIALAQDYERALVKRKKILNALGVGRAVHAAVVKELSNIMPEGTYLRSLGFGVNKGVREMRLVVDVYEMSSASVVRLKQRLVAALEDSPFFVNVSFSPLNNPASKDGRSPDESLQLACQVLGFPGD
jgi:type IV pilus assembly protein PilM